ncbi:MAG: TonB-dependent receptor [Thermodesulfobacteriota bacterium]
MKFKIFSACIALLLLVSSPMFGQVGDTGTFLGDVTDQEGTRLPGVQVTATNIQTGLTQSTITNQRGRYRLERLPRGLYTLSATLSGFKTTIRKGLELFGGAVTTVNLVMEVGTLEEEVTVVGATPIVETTRTQVSTVMTEKELLSYPQANRNYLHLMAYAPGTQPDAPIIGATTGYAINGMRGESNNYMLDGLNNNDMTDNTMQTTLLPPEAIQEFRLVTSNFNAEYGRNTGGILNVVMKSGTNELHGSAWGFYRGDSAFFRSADWLTKKREPYKRYQYGATLGGPIVKDKTFFFGTFEGIDEEIDYATSWWLLTPQAIASSSGVARQLMDRFGANYPVPTYDFVDKNGDGIADYGRGNYTYTDSLNAYMGGIKIDHIISEKDRVAFRWMYNYRKTRSGNGYGGYYWTPGKTLDQPNEFHTGGLTWMHILSPTAYNEVRLGYKRDKWEWAVQDDSIAFVAFNDELHPFGDPGYPMLQVNNTYQLADVLNIQVKDHNVKLGGEFTLWRVKSMFDAFVNGYYIFDDGLAFLANGPASYLILGADPPENQDNPYLPGDSKRADLWRTGFGLTNRKWKGYEIGLFAQDDWRISKRLSISFGLRWEFYSVPKEYSGIGIAQPMFGTQKGFLNTMAGNLDLTEGVWNEEGIRYMIFGGRQLAGKGLWNNYYGNFAPKVSFAYDLTGDGKTSLRGGYGISYDRQMNRSYENDRFNYPNFAFNSFLGSPWGGSADFYLKLPGVQVPVEAAGAVRISLRWMDPELKPQMAHNWMLGIQRELGPNFSVEIDYTGSAGRRIGGIMRISRQTGDAADGRYDGINPYVNIRDGNFRTNSFYSNYHGGQIILNKRFSDGWSWYTAYTYGVAKDLSSIYQGIVLSQAVEKDYWDLDYGYADYDHRHRIVGGFVYEIPFFRNSKNSFLRNVLSGWQIGASYHWTSGRRFNIFTPGSSRYDWNLDGQWGSDRPIWVGGSNYNEAIKKGSGDDNPPSVNPDLFAVPNPPKYPGDMSYYKQNIVPRNAFTWFPTYNIDISLQKNFVIPVGSRDFNLQLILDVFNVLKNQFWELPNMTWGLSTFGDVYRKSGDRIAQISIRFMF